jgi:hypothetical protein
VSAQSNSARFVLLNLKPFCLARTLRILVVG